MMTNFFGFNVTKGQESDKMDCISFVTRTISDEESERIAQYRQDNDRLEKKAELPTALGVLKGLCWVAWLIILFGILESDVGLIQGYNNAPLLHWIGFLCFVTWLALLIYGKMRVKRTVQTTEFDQHVRQINQFAQEAMQTLDIPENAESIDVLAERYVMKKGVPKHRDSGLVPYVNFDLFIFVQDGSLCLADLENVWEIPLSSLRSMTLEKKRYGYPEWHKSEPPSSKMYKPYKITTNNYGHYFSRCYRIEIRDIRGEFYLLIPEYDGEIFTNVTHLRPEVA